MINYTKPLKGDIILAQNYYLVGLKEVAEKFNFEILSDKTSKKHIEFNEFAYVIQHPKFKGDMDNHFQVTMNRGMGAEIYPPVRITIWFANEKINFQQTLDLQYTNIETVKYIIKKLIDDYC